MNTWWFKDIKNIFFVIGAAFIICSLFTLAFLKMDVTQFTMAQATVTDRPVYECIFAPIFEEVIFRWAWIAGMIIIVGNKTFKKFRWPFAALLSVIFGAAHYGYFSIYIQGVLGFGLCYLYYKNRYGYWSAVLCHAIWNTLLGVILPAIS